MTDTWVAHKISSRDTKEESHFLQPSHIQMIEEALCSLGDYGEVRLVVEKGHLRFLITQKSYDTLKWCPGTIKDVNP